MEKEALQVPVAPEAQTSRSLQVTMKNEEVCRTGWGPRALGEEGWASRPAGPWRGSAGWVTFRKGREDILDRQASL